MIRRCTTTTQGFIAQLFHHHNLSVFLYSTGIVGQRNLALGLISSTEVPQQITALLQMCTCHTNTHRLHREKEVAIVGVTDQKGVLEQEVPG